jgi:hypothetical protein
MSDAWEAHLEKLAERARQEMPLHDPGAGLPAARPAEPRSPTHQAPSRRRQRRQAEGEAGTGY